MTNTLSIAIPFQGFNQSEIDSIFDLELEEMLEHDYDFDQDLVDWSATRKNVAKSFAEHWCHEWGMSGVFDELVSPREYNFVTDRIFVNFSPNDLIQIKTKCRESLDNFRAYIKDTCTSRSGFISFIDNDLNDWPDEWSELHWEIALVFLESEEKMEDHIVETMRCNGYFQLEVKSS